MAEDERPVEAPVTDLDQALSAVRKDSKQAGDFYDTFLNAEVFIPVRVEGAPTAAGRRLAPEEKFHPLFLKHENIRVVPLFDRLDRLQDWSGERTFDYLQLRCHIFLNMLAPGIGVAINLGHAWSHYFTADILEKIRKAMRPVNPS